MVDKVAVDELIDGIDSYLTELLRAAAHQTLKTAAVSYDCENGSCGCHGDDSTN